MIKISITGPESTGKSWLSRTLAQVFDTIWVPEFARTYLTHINRPYTLDDVIFIAQQQRLAENIAACQQPELLFCDTDIIVCKIWCEVKYGFCPYEIQRLRQEDDYDIYLLTYIDLPWTYDPLREHPHFRHQLFELYLNELQQSGHPYEIVSGIHGQRLKNAVEYLLQHFPHITQWLKTDQYKNALSSPWLT